MSLAATTSKETALRDVIDEAVKNEAINTVQFIGRRVRINGGNYVFETVISGMLFALTCRDKKQVQWERPIIKNIRLHLKDSSVSIDKKRYKMTRAIDHLSYAAVGTNCSDMKVVFKDDGLETIKAASMELLD